MFNTKVQLKNAQSVIKPKLINLLAELKTLRFATTLVLEFKKILTDDKTLYMTHCAIWYQTLKNGFLMVN